MTASVERGNLPGLLERTAAVAFFLSSVLTGMVAISAWPVLTSELVITEGLHWLFRTAVFFTTILALSVAWLLPRRSLYPWLGVLALPLLVRHLRDGFWGPGPWPVALGVVSAVYLAGALTTAVAMMIRYVVASQG